MPNAAQRLLNLRPDERKPLVLLLAFSFCQGFFLTLFDTCANAVFLETFGPESLPFTYMAVAAFCIAVGLVYFRLGRFLKPANQLSLLILFSVVSVAVFYALLIVAPSLPPAASTVIAFLFFCWRTVLWLIAPVAFWATAGSLFDVRQGKRLFGLAGSGEIAAGIVSGLLVTPLVRLGGVIHLLIPAGVASVLCLVVFRAIVRRYPAPFRAASVRGQSGESGESARSWFRSPYIPLFFLVTLLSFLGYYFVDRTFFAEVSRISPNGEAVAEFFGTFYAILGGATLVVSLFFSGKFIMLFGIGFALLVLPVTNLLGLGVAGLSAVSVLPGAVFTWAVAAIKLSDETFRTGFENPAYKILYQPLPANQRLRVQTVRELVVQPVAIGISGLLLWLLNPLYGNPLFFTIATTVCVVGWIAGSSLLKRQYIHALSHSFAHRKVDWDAGMIRDKAALALLENKLSGAEPSETLYCLKILDGENEILRPRIEGFLEHPDERIRVQAAVLAERIRPKGVEEMLKRRDAEEANPDCRVASLKALVAVSGREGREALCDRMMSDGDPGDRSAIAAGFLQNGSPDERQLAVGLVEDFAAAQDPVLRAHAAGIVEDAPDPRFGGLVKGLLGDRDPAVLEKALLAAGALKDPECLPLIVAHYARSALRLTCVKAASRFDGAKVRHLCELFDAPGTDEQGKICLIKALSRRTETEAAAFLKRLFRYPDRRLRDAAYKASFAAHYAAPEADHADVRGLVDEAAGRIALFFQAGMRLRERKHALVRRALSSEIARAREDVFHLLSFLCGHTVVKKAKYRFSLGTKAERAKAVEILDNILPPGLKPAVLAMMEDLPPERRLEALSRFRADGPSTAGEALRTLLAVPEQDLLPWTRAMILLSLRLETDGPAELAAGVLEVLERHPESVVRESVKLYRQDPALWTQTKQGVRRMQLTIERVLLLKTIGLFAAIDEDHLSEIAELIEEKSVAKGTVIIRKDDIGSTLFVVAGGKVRVHDGERTLALLGERAVFGELTALDPEPRSASVTAIEDTHLLSLEREALYELLEDRPDVMRALFHILCGRVREMNRRLTPKPVAAAGK